MKRLILIFWLCLFYLAACTNSSTHSHNGETHAHENADHSHNADADHAHDADAEHGHSHTDGHGHSHEQEEFTVEPDTLKQDSLENQ